MASDILLCDRLLARDRGALTRFYRDNAPRLRRHIATRISAREDAEEVLQDTLFAFLEGLRDWRGRSSLRTYLFSICQHKIVDYYRRKKIRHAVFSQMPQLETLVSPLLGPEQELDAVLIREKIASVMNRLLPVYRRILIMKYMEQITVGEIADRLAVSIKSAESRLFRARRAFVELFLSI